MPPQVLYFGAVGAVLGAIWLAQRGKPQAATNGSGAAGPGGKGKPQTGGEGDIPLKQDATYGSYQYNYNEQPANDPLSPYGGRTDNSTPTVQQSQPAGSYPGLTPVNPAVTTTYSRTGATIAPDVPTGGATYTAPQLTPVSSGTSTFSRTGAVAS